MQAKWLGALMLALCISMPATSADPAEKLFLSASKAERNGETSKALNLYKEIVNRYPKSPLAIKASNKLTEKKREAVALAAKQRAEAKTKVQEAARMAERHKRQEAEAKMQEWMQQCMNQRNQCKQACVSRYGRYSEYKQTTCEMDCDSRQDCNPYTTGKVDCLKHDAGKIQSACWGAS